MDKEMSFCLKVVRNALILSVLYLVSVWSATELDLDWKVIKPVIIFLLAYIATELAKHYKIDYTTPKPTRSKTAIKTFTTLIY